MFLDWKKYSSTLLIPEFSPPLNLKADFSWTSKFSNPRSESEGTSKTSSIWLSIFSCLGDGSISLIVRSFSHFFLKFENPRGMLS